MPECACGMPMVTDTGLVAWSTAWAREHKQQHLDTFPQIADDMRTIRTLDDAIHRAQQRETHRAERLVECDLCTPAAARACRDPRCREAGHGEPHGGEQ